MEISDVVLLIGAVGGLVTVVTAAIVSLRRINIVQADVDIVKTDVDVVKTDVKEVHSIVNQQRTDMLAYQETLIEVLKARGIHVPTDESKLKE